MLAFGLRRGEALGLRWSALDGDTATLKVTHVLKRVRARTETSELRTRLMIGELKTARSRRTLFLTPELVEFRCCCARSPFEAPSASGIRDTPCGAVLGSQLAVPIDPKWGAIETKADASRCPLEGAVCQSA